MPLELECSSHCKVTNNERLNDYICKKTGMDSTLKAFERLLMIMDDLRKGCPWDREQTYESLRHLTIEETYELSDAILEGDLEGIRNELGDLMLHIVFYAKIGSESGSFSMEDVLVHITQKLIKRHPHIYGDVKVSSARDVKDNWEKIKLNEGRNSVLEGVPGSLPSLVKAYRIQEKARGVGFDWEHIDQVWEKVLEEKEELKAEILNDSSRSKMEEEFGDLLFALVNYARFLRINPEDALERSNKKFIKRFQLLEDQVRKEGKNLSEMTLSEMDVYWEEAKRTANGERRTANSV
jgi:XTP/dITP diphosphohydrolase